MYTEEELKKKANIKVGQKIKTGYDDLGDQVIWTVEKVYKHFAQMQRVSRTGYVLRECFTWFELSKI